MLDSAPGSKVGLSTRAVRRLALGMVTALWCGSAAWGQVGVGNSDPLAPEEEPVLRPETPPERSPTEPAARPTLEPEPVRGPTAPLPSQDVGRGMPGGLLAEGSFVAGALGRPAEGKSGAWYFVFDSGQRGPGGVALPAMVLLPSVNLASLERAAPRLSEDDRLRISGQVFVYNGLNYLMLMAPPVIEPKQRSEQPPTAAKPAATDEPVADNKTDQPQAAPGQPEPAGTPDEPSIDEIIDQLERTVGSSRRVELPARTAGESPDTGTGASPSTDTRPATALVPGGYLASRRGRLTRASDGLAMFAMDSGQSGRAESPMVLLPCQNLTRMESIAAGQGERVTYTVSGDVFVYRGRNYLLPRLYVVNRPTDLVISGQ